MSNPDAWTRADPWTSAGPRRNAPRRNPRATPGAGTAGAFAALCLSGIVAGLAPGALPAQETPATSGRDGTLRPLALAEALEIARERNTGLRVAGARSEAARAEARIASSTLLPQLGLESGWTRTVDPVGAFGTKLQQGVFGEEDLAIEPLNDPDPITDFTTSVVARWSVASPREWALRQEAGSRAEAAGWRRVRTREATDFRTRALYFRALQAGGRTEAAEAAVRAASATRDRFRRRFEEGLLTRADLLQAEAELEAARADLVAAGRGRHEARVALGLHLGWGPERLPVPTDGLPPPTDDAASSAGELATRPDQVPRSGDDPVGPAPAARPGGESFDPTARADLRARAAVLRAAEAARTGARLAWAPRLEAFAGYSIHGDDLLSDSGEDWTVGVALRWDAFTGLARPARARRAAAESWSAELEYRQELREARAEVRIARRTVGAARRAVEASRAARAAAREGRDLLRRRFEEGLATPADLLQAEARATTMEVRAVDALAQYHVALARLRFLRSEPSAGRSR